MRSAVFSDLKIAAGRRIPRIFRKIRRGRRRRSEYSRATATSTPSSSARYTTGQQQQQDLVYSEDVDGGGDHVDSALTLEQQENEREARAVSRRLVRKRALRGARRRPILVVRVAAAVLAAAGRGVGSVRDVYNRRASHAVVFSPKLVFGRTL